MSAVWTTERKIVLGFGAALTSLFVVAGMAVWLTLSLLGELSTVAEQNRRIAEQNEILSKISKLNAMIPELAYSARLFTANRDDKSYAEWLDEDAAFEKELNELDEMTRDSPTQRDRMALIRQQLNEKATVTREVHQGDPPNGDELLVDAWGIVKGNSQVREISDLMIAMSGEERDLLRTINKQESDTNGDARSKATAAFWAIGIAFTMALLLIGAAVATILRDLGARRRAAEELDRARKAAEAASVAKSAFLANMSHELRTPLTSIMGYVDLMLNPTAAAAARPEYLQTIRRSGEHLLNLINDILDVSKIEAGRMTLEIVECSLVDVLADIESLMRSRAIGKGIDFSIEFQTQVPQRVRTDPTRFRQIVMNLVSNAVKFTDEGSVRVAVSCKDGTVHGGHRVVVEVIDTGVGISPEQQRLLFQPFTQADISTTRRFGGTGLGLSISRRLAQMLKGELSVRSEAGRGSTFRLSLPMEHVPGAATLPAGQAQHIVQEDAAVARRVPQNLNLRVLLAEDGAENRDIILLHLRQAGCTAMAVEDGQQAFETALQAMRAGQPFDIVLMDMQMPVMDGYTATSKLRAQAYAGPIIALTAHAMKEDRQRCLQVGCDDYVPKPVNVPELLRLMARFAGVPAGGRVVEQMMENPALRQLTRKFCDGLPQTLAGIWEMSQAGRWEDVSGAAHRLAGAGGAYGFDDITRDAKALERAARANDGPAATQAFENLAQTCAAARQRVEASSTQPPAPSTSPVPAL